MTTMTTEPVPMPSVEQILDTIRHAILDSMPYESLILGAISDGVAEALRHQRGQLPA
jgi:hypothetical protein